MQFYRSTVARSMLRRFLIERLVDGEANYAIASARYMSPSRCTQKKDIVAAGRYDIVVEAVSL